MATNRDLLKEAIADAKAVKETAIANAKAALEEAFTPYLKEKLSAKLAEMDSVDEIELDETKKAEETKEGRALFNKNEGRRLVNQEARALVNKNEGRRLINQEDMTEEVSLDELLAELEKEESMEKNVKETYMDEDIYEAKDEEEEMDIEDMSEDDLKSFIEDVIKDMVTAGELEAGDAAEGEGEEMDMEDDEEIDITELLAELEAEETNEGRGFINKNEARALVNQEARRLVNQEGRALFNQEARRFVNQEEKIDEASMVYLTEAEKIISILITLGVVSAAVATSKAAVQGLADALSKSTKAAAQFINKLKSSKTGDQSQETDAQLEELRSELNEVNLLNAKLLYTNKIFRNKSLTESQKVKVLTSFDKATSKKEVELVYETLMESLKMSTMTKAPIKESLSSASKALGGVTSKPIIENDAFARMRELAFGGKK